MWQATFAYSSIQLPFGLTVTGFLMHAASSFQIYYLYVIGVFPPPPILLNNVVLLAPCLYDSYILIFETFLSNNLRTCYTPYIGHTMPLLNLFLMYVNVISLFSRFLSLIQVTSILSWKKLFLIYLSLLVRFHV